MKIEPNKITIRQLTEDYTDNAEEGVTGYGGKLDIRPPYQREFVYNDKQREAVIDTVMKEFPLNVMYWMVRDDGGYEIIDGQQRTISICQYVQGDFPYKELNFYNLQPDIREKLLDYELTVYFCTGTPSERLSWFQTINIAGAELTNQELRNAVYSGPWVTEAKRYFSKHNCAAHREGGVYLSGSAIRQAYLETAIKWHSGNKIEGYMAEHQHETSVSELWLYFRSVIEWVKTNFTNYREEMKGVPWGELYNEHKDKKLPSPKALEVEVARLMEDEDVGSKRGIYSYVLTGEEKWLNLRAFSDKQKREAYEKQKGICGRCGKHFELKAMEGDHITPWSEGGKTVAENCQMLCRECNRRKSAK